MPSKKQIKSAAGDVAEKTKAAAKEAAQSVKEQANAQAVDAKDSVAGEVKSVSSALRTASSEMRGGSAQERAIGQIAETLADVSDSIREQDLGEMVTAASDFARRNPLVFLGSATFLGFAAARFARSSNNGAADTRDQYAPSRGRDDRPAAASSGSAPQRDGEQV